MAGYNELRGLRVKYLSADPANPEDGQVWYNSTTGNLRVQGIAVGAYSSTSPVSTARTQLASGGIVTSAFIAGGYSTANVTDTEEYNGSGYSSGGAMGTARRGLGGTGNTPAALIFGGYSTTNIGNTEEYNGTSWSEQNDLSTARFALASANAAPQTAALAFGGYTPSGQVNNTEEYDGTSWTAGGSLNTANHDMSGFGTQTAAVMCGGSPNRTITENYDGSSWTSSGALNTGRELSMSFGTQTSGGTVGGKVPPSTTTTASEDYNGATWSTSPATLVTGRGQGGGSGTSSSAIISTGASPGNTSAAEEYNFSSTTITPAAWSSGSSLGTGRYQANGQNVGTKSAGLIVGGQGGDPAVTISNVEEYDGSTWSEVNNFPTTRAMLGTVGTQTAAFAFGGYGKPGGGPNPAPASPNFDTTFNYDGTNWSSETALPAAVAYLTGAGTQTAALSIGGFPALTTCNEYDGSSWTAGGSMTTGRHNGSAFGIQTAAVIAGGAPAPAGTTTDVESYDGSSWTSAATLILAKEQGGTAGTQTDGLITLGNQPNPTNSAGYNGTAWFTQPSTSTARYGGANGGTTLASAYYAGGGGGPPTRQVTEEFTAETVTVNPASNIDVS